MIFPPLRLRQGLESASMISPKPTFGTSGPRRHGIGLVALGVTLLGIVVASPATADPGIGPRPVLPAAAPAATKQVASLAAGRPAMQVERLAQTMDQWSRQVLASGQTPGLAWVMVADGRVVASKGYGVTDVDSRSAVGADTVFRLASLSKGFASSLAALLVRDGVLHWSDRVQDRVPALVLKDDVGAGHLRLDQLLSHRVGLPRNSYDHQLEAEQPYPLLVEKLDQIAPVCPVGDCYAYQNVAFSLIGDLVFASTGDFFTHQVEKRLFHPLGMQSATYGRDALLASPSHALPHVRRGGRWVVVTPKETYYRVPPAAGVNASSNDLGQWLLAQLGHRPDVLPVNLVSELHTPLVATPGETVGSSWRRSRVKSASYALGFRVYDYAGHQLVFHAGAVQGYRAMLAILPEQDFAIALMWNGESAVPTGLLPNVLDRRLALAPRNWLQLPKPVARRR